MVVLGTVNVKVYMTDFFLFFARLNLLNVLISVLFFFSIAIFLPRVLMYQKRQISLPVGCKTARAKTGLQGPRKTDFFDIFLFSYKQHTIVTFLSELISSQ